MVGIDAIMTPNIPFGLIHDGKRGQGVAEYVKPGTVCDVDGFATKGTLADMTEGDTVSEVDKIPTYNAVS